MHALLALTQSIALALAAAAGAPSPSPLPATSPQPEKAPAKPADAPAQPTKPAEKAPATPAPDPSTEDILRDMEKQRGNSPANPPTPAPALQPAGTPGAPAQPGARVQAPSGRLLREGTFLVERRGRLVRATTGDWLYTFDADAKGQADPTMVVLPCQKLEAMEKLAERYGESLSFTVTGQVFVYKNKNYILPATFRVNRADDDIKSTQ